MVRGSRHPSPPALGALVCVALATLLSLALHAQLLPDPAGSFTITRFGHLHAWAYEALRLHLANGDPALQTAHAGYPWLREARFIGVPGAAVAWSLRPLLGPVVEVSISEDGVLTRILDMSGHISPWLYVLASVFVVSRAVTSIWGHKS